MMIDPDAVGGLKIHHLIINFKDQKNVNIILPYIPPSPPTKSGTHHYFIIKIIQKEYINPFYLSSRFIDFYRLLDIINPVKIIVLDSFQIHT